MLLVLLNRHRTRKYGCDQVREGNLMKHRLRNIDTFNAVLA